jgi:hypothetical protein
MPTPERKSAKRGSPLEGDAVIIAGSFETHGGPLENNPLGRLVGYALIGLFS